MLVWYILTATTRLWYNYSLVFLPRWLPGSCDWRPLTWCYQWKIKNRMMQSMAIVLQANRCPLSRQLLPWTNLALSWSMVVKDMKEYAGKGWDSLRQNQGRMLSICDLERLPLWDRHRGIAIDAAKTYVLLWPFWPFMPTFLSLPGTYLFFRVILSNLHSDIYK